MSTVVEIAGFQYDIDKNMKLDVPYLEGKEGDTVDFDKVLMTGEGKDANIGAPYIEGANVSAKIVGQFRDKKIQVFKKKRRKGYQTLNGHRQKFTKIEITDIKA